MNNDFRQRVFLPIIMPIGAILGFFGFAFMLSRVLLAVDEFASTAIALGLATYVLALAAVVSSRPRITSRALAVGGSLGLVAVVVAGLLAAGAGMREIEHIAGEPAAAEGGGEAPAGGDASEGASEAAGGGSAEPVWLAVDLGFPEAPATLPAGETTIELVNEGVILHNVTFPDISDTPVVEADAGATAEGTVELEPGTYRYICSVPGHESAMNGELTVE